MKLHRDISGRDLAKALESMGYLTRQKGSHLRLTTEQNGQHHVTIPAHSSLKAGTLLGILRDVAEHFGISRDELADRIF